MPAPHGLEFVTLPPGCGYGDAACQYAAGLHRLGVPVRWTPTVGVAKDDPSVGEIRRNLQESVADEAMQLLRRPLACSAMLIDTPPYNAQLHWRKARPDLRAFTYVAWEVEQVPPTWLPALAPYERIFVPSEFNRRALEAAGLAAPVDVVPHVARALTPASGPPDRDRGGYGDVTDEDFVFYTIGSWTTRKAMEETIRAYLDAFTAADRVALIVKTEAVDHIALHGLSQSERRAAAPHVAMVWWTVASILAEYPRPAKLHLVAESLPAAAIDRLHARGDCFVSLTHSEGWGLGPFDAALHGKPPIVTGWGGQVEYLGADHPLLVRYRMARTADFPPDGYFHRTDTTWWAEADRAHAGELMRFVYEHPDEARAIGRRLQARLAATYAAEPVCRRLASLMGFDTAP